MADGIENVNQDTVNVPKGLSDLTGMLAGLPGADKILQDTATEAFEKGVITINKGAKELPSNDDTKNPADVKTDTVPDPGKKVELPLSEDTDSEDESENDDQEDDEEDNNPLLNAIKGKSNNKKDEISFENFDQIKNHTKKKFGIDVKSEKDFGKFFKSAEQWRQDAAKVAELETKVEQVDNLFNEMPAALLNSVKAYFNGEGDWDRYVSEKPKFDFNKPAEKQDKKALVSHYFPNKFTDADWAEETMPQSLDIAIQASRTQYNAEKRELENASATMAKQSQDRLDLMKSSTVSSLKNLKNSFPDLDKEGIKQIQKIMESGDINSLFFDKKGGFKEDAAERLLLVLHGNGVMKKMMKVSEKRAETKANEDILTRGSGDKPKPNKGGASPKQAVSEDVNKVINALVGGLNNKKTY